MLTPELYPVFEELRSLQLNLACSMQYFRTVSELAEEAFCCSSSSVSSAEFSNLVSFHFESVSNALDSFESKFFDFIELLPQQEEVAK